MADANGNFGSGWVWLAMQGDKLKIVKTSNADLPLTEGMVSAGKGGKEVKGEMGGLSMRGGESTWFPPVNFKFDQFTQLPSSPLSLPLLFLTSLSRRRCW